MTIILKDFNNVCVYACISIVLINFAGVISKSYPYGCQINHKREGMDNRASGK